MSIGKENEYTEFKVSTAELDSAIQSISAILNKHQKGVVYFGVKNDGTPVGQIIGQDTLRDIGRKITAHIEPIIYPNIEEIELEGKQCIKVEFEGNKVPYFAFGKAYMRVVDEDKQITQEQLRDLFLESSNLEEKWETEVTKYTFEDIDEDILKKCIKKGNESKRINYEYTNKKDILNRLGLIDSNGNLLNAGNALFGKNANIVLKMATFATDDKVTFLDLSRKTGNIMELIDAGEVYIKEHINWTVNFKTGRMERKEIPEIPVDSIREALLNCLCHKSMISPQEAEIAVYRNRAEIYNPGTFPKQYSPEDFIKGTGKSVLRNKLIGQTLYLSHEIEAFGTGIQRIYEECKANKVKVEFYRDLLGCSVIFYRKNEKELEKIAKEEPKDTDDIDKILKVIEKNPEITQKMITAETSIPERTVKRIMAKLQEEKVIERIGNNRKGYWNILN